MSNGTHEAAAHLRAGFIDAMVDIVAYYPPTDSWTLTQRTLNGPNVVCCKSPRLEQTLSELTAAIGAVPYRSPPTLVNSSTIPTDQPRQEGQSARVSADLPKPVTPSVQTFDRALMIVGIILLVALISIFGIRDGIRRYDAEKRAYDACVAANPHAECPR